nr:PREDICTED: golgin subfamily A member 6-like protein 2 [Musa acuminata subsp. malaccensis]
MGCVASKCSHSNHRKKTNELRAKVVALEEEMKEMRRVREQEARAFTSKEAEWEQERRQHREEAAELRKRVMEEEETTARGSRGAKEWLRLGTECLVEHLKEERARREEAVEKWKQLYLAIKTELDDLIRRTRRQRFYLGAEEGMIEPLEREAKAKEETVERLRSRVDKMEEEARKRDREIDILRQSLRILSNETNREEERSNSDSGTPTLRGKCRELK